MTSTGPLPDLRVVDLTDMRGALCGRLLGDLGAEVMWVHTPGAALASPEHVHRNAAKHGLPLDLDDPSHAEALEGWLAGADVVIENFDPDQRRRRGFDHGALAQRHPHLVHVALADFGLDGPLAPWRLEPLTAFAAAGPLFASGFRQLPPCWMPGHVAHDAASVYGAIGAVAAVMARASRGTGELVEVSVQEAALASIIPWSIPLADYARLIPGLPAAGRRNADGAYWVFPAKDGWVRTVIGNPRQWNGFVELLGKPDLLAQPEWSDSLYRLQQHDVIRLVAQDLLTDRTRQELFDEALLTGATLGILHRPSEYPAHPQSQARGTFEPIDIPGIDGAPAVRAPLRMSVSSLPPRRPAPEGDGDPPPQWPPRPSPAHDDGTATGGGLLLDGVRVVELGMAAVAPEAAGVLSELGADVIKIESEAHHDVLRQTGRGRINCAFAYNAENRGRRSVTLDLTTPEGRALALRLCAAADVVLENQRGGVLDRLGLGYEAVKAQNPSVIYASSQGYGRGGPLDEMPAYGPLNLGFAGLHLLWNHPDAPYPCGTSLNHPDHLVSKILALGVLAALARRGSTGEGEHVEMAQTEAVAYLHGEVYLQAAMGVEPAPDGNRNDAQVPHGVYPCAGDDEWVAIAVAGDDAWERLQVVLGWPGDPALRSLAGRLAARDDLDRRLGEWTSTRERWEVARLLQEHGISAMPVLGPDDHHADAHLAARRAIITLRHPEVGDERQVANPLRLSSTPQRPAASSPCLGAHTEEVLGEVLGLGPDEVAGLVERGVCR